MANFIIMAVCLVAGAIIRRKMGFRISDVRPVNIVILWISLPALVFVEVPRLFRESALSHELIFAIAMPWCGFILTTLVVMMIAKWRNWSRGTIGALALTAGLGNTAFVGFPVIEALYGENGLRTAILIDQVGTFLIVATLGLVVASFCAGRSLTATAVIRRIATFPPFLSFVIAMLWGLSPLPVEGLIVEAFQKISTTLVPLALISVGWQLDIAPASLKLYASRVSTGLALKLFAWPTCVALIMSTLRPSLTYNVSVTEAAMAPMITAAVVASEFGLESELAQLMVGLGIPLSALTLWLWHFIISF